jgi:glyoxylase-like metal-dependent hydrolase (beta-lactamase superfamily II)
MASLVATHGLVPWRALAQSSRVVDQQPWARLEELAEGIWAVVSTPLSGGDWTTGCNGGLIAGRERVLAIEGFLRPAGAEWLADKSRELTGRRPTDVLITHFHGDHVNGLQGYVGDDSPGLLATRTTLDLVRRDDAAREEPPSDSRLAMLERVTAVNEEQAIELDLGGRSVALRPRRGHTPSDVTVEIAEPSIVFCGDLVWNGLFPNYRDTLASQFSASIRDLRRDEVTTYVSGHGQLAGQGEIDALLALVDSVEQAARQGHEKGTPLEEAAAGFELPTPVADWSLFNPRYFEVAFEAWYQELG